jgi:hypothetical protein
MKKHLLNSKQGWMRYITSVMLLLLITGFCSVIKAQTVTITTDKDDYWPGEWVIISGTGWQGNDSVRLTITHLDPLPDPIHTHTPWHVIPNADGTIYEEWYVEDQEFGTYMMLEALGRPSGDYAVTYFTDAKDPKSVKINDQNIVPSYGATADLIVNYTVTVETTGSGNGDITLSIVGLPAGIASNFPLTFQASNQEGDNYESTLTLTLPNLINAGSYPFHVNATRRGIIVSVEGILNINKADQVITWANPANIVYGTLLSATQLNAAVAVPGSEAHGALTYSPAADAELAAGTHTLTANVAGSDNYNAASATVEITVDKADQVITWANPANIVYGTLLSATQLNAAVAVPGSEAHGALTYSPAADAELAAGTHTLTANVAGSDNYNAASATVEITVDKADQVITWANPANIVYGTLLSATQLNAAVAVPGSEAHGALTYSPAADAELAAGTHTLTANVAGSDNYNAASATVEITVDKADQVITWANPANIVYGTLLSATQLNAAVAVPGSEAHGALTYSPAADAELAAGTHTLTANVAGSDNYNAASATVEITVDKADQVITWANPANIVYGTLLSAKLTVP